MPGKGIPLATVPLARTPSSSQHMNSSTFPSRGGEEASGAFCCCCQPGAERRLGFVAFPSGEVSPAHLISHSVHQMGRLEDKEPGLLNLQAGLGQIRPDGALLH